MCGAVRLFALTTVLVMPATNAMSAHRALQGPSRFVERVQPKPLHWKWFWPGGCSVFSRHPCAPTVCSVFQRAPCIPEIIYPVGETLQFTVVSESSSSNGPAADGDKHLENNTTAAHGRNELNTIRDIHSALSACWIPPAADEARQGMQMTVRFSFRGTGEIIGTPRVAYKTPDAPPDTVEVYRDAIMAALERCTPLPLSSELGGAVAGRPIALRFVDNRQLLGH